MEIIVPEHVGKSEGFILNLLCFEIPLPQERHTESDKDLAGLDRKRDPFRYTVTIHTNQGGSIQFIIGPLVDTYFHPSSVNHHFYMVQITEGWWGLSKGSPSQRQEYSLDHPPLRWLACPHSLTIHLFGHHSVVGQMWRRSCSLIHFLSFFYHSAVLGSPSECVKKTFWYVFHKILQ